MHTTIMSYTNVYMQCTELHINQPLHVASCAVPQRPISKYAAQLDLLVSVMELVERLPKFGTRFYSPKPD